MSNLSRMALDKELEEAYYAHLLNERNLSDNSIRAYIADLESLLIHVNQLGVTEFSQLTINHQPVAADRIETYFDGHHLDIPLAELKASDNEIEVHFSHPYSHEGQGLHRFTDPEDQNVYLFSDFEPYHAHLMFPCFDQPDLKAQYYLQVKAPQSWQVISNTLQEQVQKNGDHHVWKLSLIHI